MNTIETFSIIRYFASTVGPSLPTLHAISLLDLFAFLLLFD